MICPNCKSDKVFRCTDKTIPVWEFWYECVECGYESRRLPTYMSRCINHPSKWEMNIRELKSEWDDIEKEDNL